jgi:hypothetical protein
MAHIGLQHHRVKKNGAWDEADFMAAFVVIRKEGVIYYAANGTLNTQLGRDNRHGKIKVLTTKFLKV